jgi:DHA1 family tetracycline resistance protein-like MFS transporter
MARALTWGRTSPLYFATYCNDAAYAISLTYFAPLVLDTTSTVVPHEWDMATRGLILGFLLAIFPLAQFFGSSIFGSMADFYGRKKLLVICLAAMSAMTFLSGAAIDMAWLWVLFASRFVAGIFGAPLALTRSMLSDGVPEATNHYRLTANTIAQGLAWIIGAVAAAKIADWYGVAAPFYGLGAMFALSAILVAAFTYETATLSEKMTKIDLMKPIKALAVIFKIPKLSVAFTAFWASQMAFFFVLLAVSPLAVQVFHANDTEVGNLFSLLAIAFNVACLIIAFTRGKYSKELILWPTLANVFVLAAACFVVDDKILIYSLLFLSNIVAGFNYCTMLNQLSHIAGPDHQGKIHGSIQSACNISEIVGPLIQGMSIVLVALPIGMAAGFYLLAFVLYLSVFKRGA